MNPIIKIEHAHLGDINGVDWTFKNKNLIASVGDDKVLNIWNPFLKD
jgi:hypothetical protein